MLQKQTYLLEDADALHDVGQADPFLVFELRALAVTEEHRRALCLPASDCLGTTGLADHVDGLTHTHVDLQGLEVFVECDEESRVHGGHEDIEEVVVISKNELPWVIDERQGDGEETRRTDA